MATKKTDSKLVKMIATHDPNKTQKLGFKPIPTVVPKNTKPKGTK